MTHPTTAPRVSSSFEALSAVLSTLVDVTLFVRGCFECTHPQKDDDRNGTWFDREQARSQAYCYINSMPTNSSEPNGGIVQIKKRSSTSYLASTLDEATNDSRIRDGSIIATRSQPNGCHPKPDIYLKSTSKTRIVCNSGTSSSSFAISVEKEYLGSRNEFIRYDGTGFQPKLRALHDKEPKRQKMESPVMHRRLLIRDVTDVDNPWDSMSLDSMDEEELRIEREKVFGNIWRSCELEDAFGDYNVTAFNAITGSLEPFPKKLTPPKKTSEKYEDIFPSKKLTDSDTVIPVEANNNIFDSESDFSCSRTSTVSNFSSLKFLLNSIDFMDLMDFIKECIFLNSDNMESSSSILKKCDLFCDTNFSFNGKCFNPTLIFDLVKQMVGECENNYYPNSISLSTELHVETVQYLTLNVIEMPFISDMNPGMYHEDNKIPEIDAVPEYIDKIANDEMRIESRAWHNYDHEEEQIKYMVYEEILNDLLSLETQYLGDLFDTKTKKLL